LRKINWRTANYSARIENEVATEIKDAVNFALNAPYPQAEEVDQDVYA
jgi:TPP-dependent pyruvate/acetoin dehydrogenase alpha subunit